jgi:putative transposase
VTAPARRHAVREVIAAAHIPERRACRFTGFPRSTHRYRPTRDDRALRERLETLAVLKPRWGYRRLHWLLVREGWVVNRKRVQRVYRAAGLHVRRRRRKRVSVARVPRPVPQGPAERWSMDFVHDTLGDGRTIRIFTVVDDFTRACPLIAVDLALPAAHVIARLDALAHTTALPRALVCDNGSEFTSQAFDQWAHARGLKLHFIRPGKPVENAYVESFNGKLRDECLNESWFVTLADAQRTIEAWRRDYNTARPHAALGGRTPAEFAEDLSRGQLHPQPDDRYE